MAVDVTLRIEEDALELLTTDVDHVMAVWLREVEPGVYRLRAATPDPSTEAGTAALDWLRASTPSRPED